MKTTDDDSLCVEFSFRVSAANDLSSLCYDDANELMLEYLQHTPEELTDMGSDIFNKILLEEDHFVFYKALRKLATGHRKITIGKMLRVVAKNGTIYWLAAKCRVKEWYTNGKPRVFRGSGLMFDDEMQADDHMKVYVRQKEKQAMIALTKSLTKCEWRVFELVYQKKSNPEIAEITFTSVSTVKSHKRHIANKLNLSSTRDLQGFAAELGLFF
jgi:ATP/maltotriose-dependent transcriptional regulator MalT